MKKSKWFKLLAFGLFLTICLGFGTALALPPEFTQLPVYIQQGIAEVAYKYGQPERFIDEVFTGMKQASPALALSSTQFAWTVDNEGWARQSWFPGNLLGARYETNVGGRLITIFYPNDGSFIFAVLGQSPSREYSANTARYQPERPIIVKSPAPIVLPPKKEIPKDELSGRKQGVTPPPEEKKTISPTSAKKIDWEKLKHFVAGETEEILPVEDEPIEKRR